MIAVRFPASADAKPRATRSRYAERGDGRLTEAGGAVAAVRVVTFEVVIATTTIAAGPWLSLRPATKSGLGQPVSPIWGYLQSTAARFCASGDRRYAVTVSSHIVALISGR